MINIEFGPSTILGIFIVFGGIILYFLRSIKPSIARDSDIFFSSLALLSGGILIFQGWRLDPILLFGQMLSSGTAVFFLLESIQLREQKTLASSKTTLKYYKKTNSKEDSSFGKDENYVSQKNNVAPSQYTSLLENTFPLDYSDKIFNKTEEK